VPGEPGPEPPRAGDAEPISRPETDDYDLLTYGEVAARLTEVLAGEAVALQMLRASGEADPATIDAVQARIDQLIASRARYEQQAETKAAFLRRFGLPPA